MVCEIEFKGHEMLPKVVMILCLALGILGVGSYLSSSSTQPELKALKQAPGKFEQPPNTKQNLSAQAVPEVPIRSTDVNVQPDPGQVSSTKGYMPPVRPSVVKNEIDEPVRFCGAETKKGTPCSRRVKGNTRCYQHIGMPAMDVTGKTGATAQSRSKPN